MASAHDGAPRRRWRIVAPGVLALGLAACGSAASTARDSTQDLVVTTAAGTDYGDASTTTRATLAPTTTAFVLPHTPASPAPRGRKGTARRPKGTTKHAGPGAVGPASAVRWAVKPSQVTLPPGGHVSGFVVAKNLGSTPGWIGAPGCASGPQALDRLAAKLCAPAGTQTRVEAGRSHT